MLRNLVITSFERGGANKNLGRRALRGKTSSKRGPRDYYKGRGSRSLGQIDSKGYFQYTPSKLPVLVVPDLTDCELKPYVDYATPLIKVAPPTAPHLDLTQAEVDLLDIVAPQHRRLRKARRDALLQQNETETVQHLEPQADEAPVEVVYR